MNQFTCKKSLIIIFLLIGSLKLPAQETGSSSKSLYLGIEPIMWVIGEKGGSIDYSVNDKFILQLYIAHYGWWWSSNEIKQFKIGYISDYILASKGPVVRFGSAFVISQNDLRISQTLLKPELTYKYMSYSNKCFYEGSGGSSYSYRQLRSFNSNVFGFNIVFVYRRCDSSDWDIPVEWFVGPGFQLAFEQMNLLDEGYSSVSPEPLLNEETSVTKFYPSLRFGVRLGFRVFNSPGE